MAEDYYPGDGEEAEANPSSGEADSKLDNVDTCLVPRSLFQGKSLKPGDEFVFRVKHEYGDEIEVEYSKGEGKPEKKGMEEEAGSSMAAFDDSFKGQETMMEG